jgi:hypothetical protein
MFNHQGHEEHQEKLGFCSFLILRALGALRGSIRFSSISEQPCLNPDST